MVDSIDSEVIDLQESAREGGAKFNAVSGCMSLLGQVTAADELLVFGDGVLPEAGVVEERLGGQGGVLVIPAEGAVEEGYERVDSEWAWAGVLRTRGSIIEGLSQLPPDSDPISALLRLSLQRGTRVIPLDGAKAMRSGWLLAKSEAQIAEYESDFLRRYASRSGFAQPLRALADLIAFRIAPAALDRSFSGTPAKLAAVLGIGGAFALGWREMPVIGLGVLALASFISDIGRALNGMLGAIHQKVPKFPWLGEGISLLFELTFVALAVLSTASGRPMDQGVLALLVVGLLRLTGQSSRSALLGPLRDRTLILTGFAVVAAFGLLKPALSIVALAIVALLLVVQRRNRITPA